MSVHKEIQVRHRYDATANVSRKGNQNGFSRGIFWVQVSENSAFEAQSKVRDRSVALTILPQIKDKIKTTSNPSEMDSKVVHEWFNVQFPST